jgi:hypothetical protein
MTFLRLYKFYRIGGRNRVNAVKSAVRMAWFY